MSEVSDLHNRAMDFAEFALLERMRGNTEKALGLFEQALKNELAAIEAMEEPVEPTYSVLHRSAATLAVDCKQLRKAEQIASKALALNPHPEIAEELRDLLEQVNFQRHLELRGIALGEDEVQLSLSGQEVGFGFVRSSELLDRIEHSSKLMYRIVERRSGEQFREKGRPKKGITENHTLFLSVPRAASFAVTLKLGGLVSQPSLPGLLGTAELIDEFLDLMRLASKSEFLEIKKRIPDQAYLQNFLALAKKIAPDGEHIRQVGFTVVRQNKERTVEITLPQSEFLKSIVEGSSSGRVETVKLQGMLRFADAIRDNSIKVIDKNGKSHTVRVPRGMMNDIVSPHWDSMVMIEGTRSVGKSSESIMLRDITPLESNQTDEGLDSYINSDTRNGDRSTPLF